MLEESVLVTTAYAFDRFFVLVLRVDRFDPPSVENVLKDTLTTLDKASVCAWSRFVSIIYAFEKLPMLVEIVENVHAATFDKLAILDEIVEIVGRKRRIIDETVDTLYAVCELRLLMDAFIVLESILVTVDSDENTEMRPDVLTYPVRPRPATVENKLSELT